MHAQLAWLPKKKKKGDRRLDYNTQKVSVTSFSVQDAIAVYQKLLFGAMFNISYVFTLKDHNNHNLKQQRLFLTDYQCVSVACLVSASHVSLNNTSRSTADTDDPWQFIILSMYFVILHPQLSSREEHGLPASLWRKVTVTTTNLILHSKEH